MGEPGGLPSMGLHRVGHDWSDLAAAEAIFCHVYFLLIFFLNHLRVVADTTILYFEMLYLRTSNTIITLGEFEFYTILFFIPLIVKFSNCVTPVIFFFVFIQDPLKDYTLYLSCFCSLLPLIWNNSPIFFFLQHWIVEASCFRKSFSLDKYFFCQKTTLSDMLFSVCYIIIQIMLMHPL